VKNYKYSAKTKNGKIVKGTANVKDLTEFYKTLENESLVCLSYTESEFTEKKIKNIYKLKIRELSMFCRKMGTMFESGMNITNILDVMSDTAEHPRLKKIYLKLYESIKSGLSLSGALKQTGNAFPLLLINMIESGEESGNVDGMLKRLSIYYEKQAKTQAKIKAATSYPKLLAILTISVILILFTFVMPEIFVMFAGMDLPLITSVMMAMSNFLTEYWYIVIIVSAALFFFYKILMSVSKVRYQVDKSILELPKVGKHITKVYSARFANTIAVLYASGLSLLSSIRLTITVMGNTYIEKKLTGIIENVSAGNSFSEAVNDAEIFEKLLSSMIMIGEETGSLDTILEATSDYYEQETEYAIDALLGILGPMLMIVMALIIGSVLVAVFIPIITGYETIGL
jgi:type IV pilus assembly protein PilC